MREPGAIERLAVKLQRAFWDGAPTSAECERAGADMREQAAELTRLRAENEKLMAEVEAQKASLGYIVAALSSTTDQLEMAMECDEADGELEPEDADYLRNMIKRNRDIVKTTALRELTAEAQAMGMCDEPDNRDPGDEA